ncbi:MAG: hypothetical protein AAGA18_14195 [Verrucomicrobiota bacterium]
MTNMNRQFLMRRLLLSLMLVLGAVVLIYKLGGVGETAKNPDQASTLKDPSSKRASHASHRATSLKNPLGRLGQLLELHFFRDRFLIQDIILRSAQVDFEATKAWIQQHLDDEKLQMALNILDLHLQDLAAEEALDAIFTAMQNQEISLADALSVLKNLPGRSYAQQKQLVRAWSQSDPEAVSQYLLASAEEGTDGLKQYYQLMPAFVSGLPEQGFSDAYALVNSMRGKRRTEIMSAFLKTYALENPTLALEKIPETRGLKNRQNLTNSILNQWAKKDPKEAYEWVQNLPPEQRTSNMVLTVGQQLAQQSPEVAATAISSGELPMDAELVKQVARHWIGQNEESLEDWVNDLSDPEIKDQAVWGWSEGLIESADADTAYRFYDQNYLGEDKNEKWLQVVSYGARQGNARQAAQSFRKIDLNAVDAHAVENTLHFIVGSWAVHDKGEDLMRWIDDITDREPKLATMESNLKDLALRSWQEYHASRELPSWSELPQN